MKRQSTEDRPNDQSPRLATSVNPRFDVVVPQKEYENAEKLIEKNRALTQKTFERERNQLVKKLESMPGSSKLVQEASGKRIQSPVPEASGKRVQSPVPESSSCKISLVQGSDAGCSLHGTSSKTGLGPETLTQEETVVVDRQSDGLLQLKFIFDCTSEMMAAAEGAARRASTKQQSAAPVKQYSVDSKKSVKVLKRGSTQDGTEAGKSSSGGKGRMGYTASAGTSVEGPYPRAAAGGGMSSHTPLDVHGPPSLAVQLMSMVRYLSVNQTEEMEPRTMRVLTVVIEECRAALKAVRQGADIDRAQEKLVKKLQELLELVRPKASCMIIPPEELLRCSYLRMSKESVKRLEELIREKGFNPGIHRHMATQSTLDEAVDDKPTARSQSTGLVPLQLTGADSLRKVQPTSVFMTKAGAPMDRTRAMKPDSVPPSEEEEMGRLKKFRAT